MGRKEEVEEEKEKGKKKGKEKDRKKRGEGKEGLEGRRRGDLITSDFLL